MTQRIARTRPSVALVFLFIVSLLLTTFIVRAPDAAAATVDQCSSEHNIAGQAIECSYQVTNTLNGAAASSTVVFTHCHGQANDPPTMACSSSTNNYTDLVTSVSQCNYAGDGGGGTMECSVDVVNNITATVTPTAATLNQCNGSADGSGVQSCSPYPASTSGATVTQCNDSGNGGGATVSCTMDTNSTMTSAVPVLINQCNNSENGGGSTVTCRASLTNNVTQPTPSPTPTPKPTTKPDGSVKDNGGTANGPDKGKPNKDKADRTPREGPSGGTPNNQTAGGTPNRNTSDVPSEADTGTPGGGITTQVTRVPVGSASTGGGSTSGVEHAGLLILGFFLLVASAFALVIGRRVSTRR
jgi:hypothetical protein